jgi:hypothetical protein
MYSDQHMLLTTLIFHDYVWNCSLSSFKHCKRDYVACINSFILDDLNILSTVITICTAGFNIKELRISAQSVFMFRKILKINSNHLYI